VLERVLALVGRREHVAAERQDAPVVAVVDRLEGRLAPSAHELHEAFVGRHPQQRSTGEMAERRRTPHR
jgi:hypothetical protein